MNFLFACFILMTVVMTPSRLNQWEKRCMKTLEEQKRLNVRLYEMQPLVRSKVKHSDTFRSCGNSPNSKGDSEQNISVSVTSVNKQTIHRSIDWSINTPRGVCLIFWIIPVKVFHCFHSSDSLSLCCFTSCVSLQFKAVYSWRLLLWSSHRKWVVSQTSKLLF